MLNKGLVSDQAEKMCIGGWDSSPDGIESLAKGNRIVLDTDNPAVVERIGQFIDTSNRRDDLGRFDIGSGVIVRVDIDWQQNAIAHIGPQHSGNVGTHLSRAGIPGRVDIFGTEIKAEWHAGTVGGKPCIQKKLLAEVRDTGGQVLGVEF